MSILKISAGDIRSLSPASLTNFLSFSLRISSFLMNTLPEYLARTTRSSYDLERLSQKTLIDQALYLETKMRLLNLTLPLSDKMSMANSVENRPLFLDHELVEFCFRIPHHYKMQGLSEKNILKKAWKRCCRRKYVRERNSLFSRRPAG